MIKKITKDATKGIYQLIILGRYLSKRQKELDTFALCLLKHPS